MAFLSKLRSVELPVSSVWDCLSTVVLLFVLFVVFSSLNKQCGQTATNMFLV